ncbi:MAG: hypothetical protein ACE5I3_14890 [Phycisphaerae bacterium]
MSTSESEPRAPAKPTVSFGPATPTAADRRQLTVSAPTLAVLVAATAVLLAVAFSAGRRYESSYPSVTGGTEFTRGENDEADAGAGVTSGVGLDASRADRASGRATSSEQSTGVANGAAAESGGDGAPQVTLRKGYHYVIVQHFRKKSEREAALKAGRYLQENGVACARLTGADIRLVAAEPFLIKQRDAAAARRQKERADRLMRRIKQIGRQFNKDLLKQGEKGYTFSECYLFEIR